MRDLLPDDSSIRLIHIDEDRSIGEKRNFACSKARSEIICHWDDDDWSGPNRLRDQLPRLQHFGVTGYHSMRFTDGTLWWNYIGAPNYALGTTLCYKRHWWETHPFPFINVAEDNRFVEEAQSAGQLFSVPAGDHMYATIHAGNTSPKYIASNWRPIDRP